MDRAHRIEHDDGAFATLQVVLPWFSRFSRTEDRMPQRVGSVPKSTSFFPTRWPVGTGSLSSARRSGTVRGMHADHFVLVEIRAALEHGDLAVLVSTIEARLTQLAVDMVDRRVVARADATALRDQVIAPCS